MAKHVSPQLRERVLTSARQLIKAGVGRRGMDYILRTRYGVSLSRDTFSRLYHERQTQTTMERVSRPASAPRQVHKMVNTERGRYEELYRRGFVHEEALAFSKAQSLRYQEFRHMTLTRQSMLRSFLNRTGLQTDSPEFTKEWREYVRIWYQRNNLTTFNAQLKRVISPWDWFDKVSTKLPPEARYSTKGRRKNFKNRTKEETAAMRAFRLKAVNDLKETLAKQPYRALELIPKIQKLGGKVPASVMKRAGL